jgi:hypothetical protein
MVLFESLLSQKILVVKQKDLKYFCVMISKMKLLIGKNIQINLIYSQLEPFLPIVPINLVNSKLVQLVDLLLMHPYELLVVY